MYYLHFLLYPFLPINCLQIDTLEYIHGCGYVHADIKPGNLLVGTAAQAPVYLLDFGLACRYKWANGQHKEYGVDERRAHYGTIEYTSRDAHIGGRYHFCCFLSD